VWKPKKIKKKNQNKKDFFFFKKKIKTKICEISEDESWGRGLVPVNMKSPEMKSWGRGLVPVTMKSRGGKAGGAASCLSL